MHSTYHQKFGYVNKPVDKHETMCVGKEALICPKYWIIWKIFDESELSIEN